MRLSWHRQHDGSWKLGNYTVRRSPAGGWDGLDGLGRIVASGTTLAFAKQDVLNYENRRIEERQIENGREHDAKVAARTVTTLPSAAETHAKLIAALRETAKVQGLGYGLADTSQVHRLVALSLGVSGVVSVAIESKILDTGYVRVAVASVSMHGSIGVPLTWSKTALVTFLLGGFKAYPVDAVIRLGASISHLTLAAIRLEGLVQEVYGGK